MKRPIKLLTGLFLALVPVLLCSRHDASAQWVQTNGPEGGGIPSLFRDGVDLYAGTYGNAGVFKSTDDGATWTQKINGMGYQTVEAIDKSGSYLLATGTVGLYRSTDNGDTWTQSTGLAAGSGVRTLVVDGSTVYAGTSGGGVFVSTDEGGTWTAANTGLPNSFGFTYAGGMVKAALGVIASVSDNSTYGIYRTTDVGATWTKIDNGLPAFTQLNALHRDGSTIFGGGPTVYKSTNDGADWTESGTGIVLGAGIDDIASSGSGLFVASFTFLYRSTDGGTTWTTLGGGIPFMATTSLAFGGSTLYAGTIANGVYASTDNGDAWTQRVTGLYARDMTEFLIDGSTLYGNGNGIFSTADGGDAWSIVRGDLRDSSSQPTLIYVDGMEMFCRDFPALGIERSTDGGATWTWSAAGLPAFGTPTSMISAGGNLYTVSDRVYRSTDGGQTWVQADSMLGSFVFLSNITKIGGTIFAYGLGIARSLDDGMTWTLADTGIPQFFGVAGFTSVGSTLFAAGGFPVANYKSTDNGDTWTPVAILPSSSAVTHLLGHGNDLFACGQNNGIFISTNLGASWTRISTGLPTPNFRYSFAIHQNMMYAGTSGNSVWKRPLSEVTAVDRLDPRVPSGYGLRQNYPNPFNPVTEIRFDVAEAAQVKIELFDVLGRSTALLVDERLAPGAYSVRWDAAGSPSGIYWYRMSAGGFVRTEKMILLK